MNRFYTPNGRDGFDESKDLHFVGPLAVGKLAFHKALINPSHPCRPRRVWSEHWGKLLEHPTEPLEPLLANSSDPTGYLFI